MSEQVILPVVLTLVTTVVGVLCVLIKKLGDLGLKYLDEKIGAQKVDELEKAAIQSVRWLEQSPAARDLTNEKKKELLLLSIQETAARSGIEMSAVAIDKIAEAAVHEIKSQFPWVQAPEAK